MLTANSGKFVSLDLSGSTMTSIGWDTFGGCTSLTSVTIPSSVTKINGWAFSECTNLTRVTFAAGSNILLANFGEDAFSELQDGDDRNSLREAYFAAGGGAGTYTRDKESARIDLWTKQP